MCLVRQDGCMGGDGARERVPSFFRGMQPIHSVVGLGALLRRTALVRRWAQSLLLQPDYNLRHRFPMTEEEGEDQRRRRRRRRCLEAPSSPRYPFSCLCLGFREAKTSDKLCLVRILVLYCLTGNVYNIKHKINVMKQVFVFHEYDLASDGPLRRAVVCRTKVQEKENIKSGEASCVQLFLGTTNEIKVFLFLLLAI